MSKNTTLPPPTPTPTQTSYLSIKPLVAGTIHLPLNRALHEYHSHPDDVGIHAPAFAFLITHPTKGKVLFDLGIRKKCEGYPPALISRIHDVFRAACEEDVADQLRKGGVRPEDIQTIILSHVHWDHIGDPSLFPNAEIVMGEGTRTLLNERVYPANPDGRITALPEGHKLTFIDFHPSTTPVSTESEDSDVLPLPVISPLATFDRAVDFFGDGSLYLVDTPGHIPGHLSALARVAHTDTPDATEVFLFLGGDLCHHREAYEPGLKLTSETMYEDLQTARETVRRLVRLNAENSGVVVVLAHEPQRLEEGMPLFPGDVAEWAVGVVQRRMETKLKSQSGVSGAVSG